MTGTTVEVWVDGALSVAALFSTSSLTSLLKLSVARSICLYSFSNRARSTTDEKVRQSCSASAGQLSLDVTREMALVFLFSEFASSCASSRLNDTLSTARRLRAASDWVLNVAMVVLPTTQLTVLPGVKVKPSLDSPLQVAPVTRWLPPRVR